MNINYQPATAIHLNWLSENDNLVSKEILSQKIAAQEIIVALDQEEVIGWLRFSFFWDSIPFINLLWVVKNYRNQRIGTELVQTWEKNMKSRYSSPVVMTSSQSNETGQHFFRKIGYKDAGNLLLPKEPLEILFIKEFV